MTQTTDGFLWFGDASGLYRFDALRFSHYEFPDALELSASPVFSLFAPPTGGLWIGYTLGGAALLKDGHVHAFSERDGLPAGSVKAFAQEADGTVWLATSHGLARLRGDRWESIATSWRLPPGGVVGLMFDSTGRLWINSESRTFVLDRGRREIQEVGGRHRYTGGLAESASGNVWLLADDTLVRLGSVPATGKTRTSSPTGLVFDRGGSVWVHAQGGVEAQRIARASEPPPGVDSIVTTTFTDWVPVDYNGSTDSNLLLDGEDNAWAMTGRGVLRLSPPHVLALHSTPGWPPEVDKYYAGLVALDQGEAMLTQMATARGLAFNGRAVRSQDFSLHPTCVHRTLEGAIWLGSREALQRIDGGHHDRIAIPEELAGDVQAIQEDSDNGLWVSIVRKGVYRYADGHWSGVGGGRKLPASPALVISSDAQRRIWFGYPDGSVALLDHGEVQIFGSAQGLRVGHVLAIYGQRKKIWVGGDAGLARFDGRSFQSLSVDGPNALRSITGLVETEDGDLWLNGGAGLARLPAAALARATAHPDYKIVPALFDASQGVEGTSARIRPLPSLIEGTDHRLWAVTSVDVYGIDPHQVAHPLKPPAISLQYFSVDDRPFAVEAAQVLPEHASALKFVYEGLSLSAAEQVRFRYRIDGVDRDWQPAHDRREAYYMNLPPGRYRFRVQATLAGQPWPPAEATLDFEIPPAFVQTRWFDATCLVALAAATAAFIRWRVRQLAKPMRIRLQARLAERERIARELHDTLLQSTQALVMNVEAAALRIPAGETSRTILEGALDDAQRAIVEGRDRIQDLRLKSVPTEDLAGSLQALGIELQAHSPGIRFGVDVKGDVQNLREGPREEIYRIAREAVLNAFRHAEAKTIAVKLSFTKAGVRCQVIDDGRGIDSAVKPSQGVPGHWGLSGMAERARIIGGQLEVKSNAGQGTVIELQVSASNAFVGQTGWRRLPRWMQRWLGDIQTA